MPVRAVASAATMPRTPIRKRRRTAILSAITARPKAQATSRVTIKPRKIIRTASRDKAKAAKVTALSLDRVRVPNPVRVKAKVEARVVKAGKARVASRAIKWRRMIPMASRGQGRVKAAKATLLAKVRAVKVMARNPVAVRVRVAKVDRVRDKAKAVNRVTINLRRITMASRDKVREGGKAKADAKVVAALGKVARAKANPVPAKRATKWPSKINRWISRFSRASLLEQAGPVAGEAHARANAAAKPATVSPAMAARPTAVSAMAEI